MSHPRRPNPPGTDAEAEVTSRYLRLGMVALVVMLGASVVVERVQAPGCWQTSLSAYYHTPVRSIFVGSLMAIGLCLIVIRGNDAWQDVFLNVAGMLAPVVALVPTSDSGRCLSTEELPSVADDAAPRVLAQIDIASVQNNLFTYFVTGILALLATSVWRRRQGTALSTTERFYRVSASFAITAALVGIGFVLFVFTNWFERVAHLTSAAGMFLCLGVVVFIRWRASRETPYGPIYKVVWQGMALSAVVAAVFAVLSFLKVLSVGHTLLLLEVAEITLFVVFWLSRAYDDWRQPSS